MADMIALFGRILLAAIFLLSGVSKIWSYQATAAYMASKGIPYAPFFLFGAVLFEVSGAVSLITGFRARLGALLLVGFLIPVTYIFHIHDAFDANFNVIDQKELISALKNVSILGGLLTVYASGPGKFSIGRNT